MNFHSLLPYFAPLNNSSFKYMLLEPKHTIVSGVAFLPFRGHTSPGAAFLVNKDKRNLAV